MRYIRINEINLKNKEKFDKYTYYFNNQLKEVELNKCFTLTKQVISHIFELDDVSKIVIIIRVINDELKYLIGYDSNTELEFANLNIEPVKYIANDEYFKDSVYGVINPINMNLKESNLIDEILAENRGNNFELKIQISNLVLVI